MKVKIIIGWVLAIATTIGASVYQRMTGPTHSKKVHIEICDTEMTCSLPRSGGEVDQDILLKDIYSNMESCHIDASVFWRRFPTDDSFQEIRMQNSSKGLVAKLPVQPAAGKLEYYIKINNDKGQAQLYFENEPLIIRFKSDVPSFILVPHILFMFFAMLFGAFAFFGAFTKLNDIYPKYLLWSTFCLLIGGFIFGPLVQKYAFDAYWTGFPFGMDLTDNKTLIAALFMLGATLCAFKTKYGRIATLIAVHVLFIIFSIPHSSRGSEYNYSTEQVDTAK